MIPLAAAEERNFPYKVEIADFSKGAPVDITSRNPFAKMPVADHKGFSLYESQAIAEYVNDLAGPGENNLIPTDIQEKARMNQFISIGKSEILSHMGMLVYNRFVKVEINGAAPDLEATAAAVEKMQRGLDVLEARLAECEYLAGSRYSLADLVYQPFFFYLNDPMFSFPEVKLIFTDKRPKLAAWVNKCKERPAWKKVHGMALGAIKMIKEMKAKKQ